VLYLTAVTCWPAQLLQGRGLFSTRLAAPPRSQQQQQHNKERQHNKEQQQLLGCSPASQEAPASAASLASPQQRQLLPLLQPLAELQLQ
jgi:hypothetical protein